MIDARFRPISTWPRARETRTRIWPSFKVTFNTTLDRLEKELDFLKAVDVVIETNHTTNDLRNDGWPRSTATNPSDPGVILSFTSKHGPLRLPSDRFQSWQTNLHAIALHLEHLRLASAYGVGEFGEQYKGWARLEAGAPIAMEVGMTVEACAVFMSLYADPGLDVLFSAADYKAAYRTAAATLHTDRGGSRETWDKLQRAKAVLRDDSIAVVRTRISSRA